MALTGAERIRQWRERKKKQGVYEAMKKSDRLRKRLMRVQLKPQALQNLRIQQNKNLIKHRKRIKNLPVSNAPNPFAFGSKQTLAKSVKKVMKALPVDRLRQMEVIQNITEKLGLLSKTKFTRNVRCLPSAT
ncbi:unnamed protein product [Didymodactylos carnosus]|uniref:Uncharacterized protein n=1 Tax=Didymodactylos carnosus TaxID=1234261 RepID=A0A8S2CUM5_9BILA|nr:unnamed protein product [Didymodactylos carnosus]CAF3589824.1 unnamed protein product [Didymodactylos carnosus]